MAGETYEAVTRCLRCSMQSSATLGWKGTGSKLITRSDLLIRFPTMAWSAISTSTALAFSCLRVRFSASDRELLAGDESMRTTGHGIPDGDIPTISSTSPRLQISETAGPATIPLPSIKTRCFLVALCAFAPLLALQASTFSPSQVCFSSSRPP